MKPIIKHIMQKKMNEVNVKRMRDDSLKRRPSKLIIKNSAFDEKCMKEEEEQGTSSLQSPSKRRRVIISDSKVIKRMSPMMEKKFIWLGQHFKTYLLTAGMPTTDYDDADEWEYRQWRGVLVSLTIPTFVCQRKAIEKFILDKPDILISRMIIKTAQLALESEKHGKIDTNNEWKPKSDFIDEKDLRARCYNVFRNAKIFHDCKRPHITAGRSQSIECRTSRRKIFGKTIVQCRVNPFHVKICMDLIKKKLLVIEEKIQAEQ